MFEKEAEEISNKLVEKGCVAIVEDRARQDMQYAFKKGAELGYNKCREEINKKGIALQSDMDETIKQNIALKRMIEQMKCCGNCAKNGHICVAEEMQGKLCGKNKDKWELKR